MYFDFLFYKSSKELVNSPKLFLLDSLLLSIQYFLECNISSVECNLFTLKKINFLENRILEIYILRLKVNDVKIEVIFTLVFKTRVKTQKNYPHSSNGSIFCPFYFWMKNRSSYRPNPQEFGSSEFVGYI